MFRNFWEGFLWLLKLRSKGPSLHSFSSLLSNSYEVPFFKNIFALRALARFTIPKSVWLSGGITQSTSAGQQKQKRYVRGYERTVNPTKYFSNDASGDQFPFLEALCLEGSGLRGFDCRWTSLFLYFWRGDTLQWQWGSAWVLKFPCVVVHSYCV